MTRLASFVLFLAVASTSLLADDWPSWRGPAGNGVTAETGLPQQWSDSSGVQWRVKLPGAGVSTPIVSGAHVFVTSQIGSSRRRPGNHPSLVQGADAGERNLGGPRAAGSGITFAVTAYRWADGGRAWQHETPADGPLADVHDKHNLSTPSPVSDGQIVIGWFGTGQVVALDAASGKALWTKHLGKEYGPFEINWARQLAGAARRPRDLPLLSRVGRLPPGARQATGAVRWKRDRQPGAHSYSTPLVVTHDNRSTVILNSSQGWKRSTPRRASRSGRCWRRTGSQYPCRCIIRASSI